MAPGIGMTMTYVSKRRAPSRQTLLRSGMLVSAICLAVTSLMAEAADLDAAAAPASAATATSADDTATGTAQSKTTDVQLAPTIVNGEAAKTTFAPQAVKTGQYAGLDVLDVPATVNTVTSDVLKAQAATGLFDALRNVAGVNRQQLSGIAYDQLSIRGIAMDNRSSYFLNGVLPIDNNIWMPMEDKERVEVLKGASALYYGFTVPAGVVNMVFKHAGNEPVTTASTLIDSNGSIGAHVDIARRFGENKQFGIRVNAMEEHVESSIQGNRGYRRFQSVALDWRATDRLKLSYDMEHIDQQIVEQAGITPLAAVNGKITLPGLPSATTLLSDGTKPTTSTAMSQILRADYHIADDWDANFTVGQSITQRNRWLWILQKYNVTSGTGTLQGSQQNGQIYENKNIRAELNGTASTAGITHNLTFGVNENWLFQPDFTTYYWTTTQNLYSPIDVSTATLTAAGSKAFYAQHIQTRGVYAIDRIDLTPKWQFTAAARWSSYHQTQAGTTTEDVNRVSPSASLLYKLTPSTSLYASYVEGLESPGSAPSTASNAYQVLPAAVSRQEEFGVRHRFSNDSLLTVAFFNLRQPVATTNADNVYALGGNGKYQGIEFSLQGGLTQNLSAVLTGMLLNARQQDTGDATTEGKRPENTPRYTASAFLNYQVPFVHGLSVNAGAYYISSRPINDANQAWIGGYTLYTLGARYETRIAGKKASFQLNVDNASNKRYWASAGSSQLGIGLARTAMLTSTIEF